MKTFLLVFALAVIALSFATARFPQDAQAPGAEQGSMAWHRQVEHQHRQERYFHEVQERAIQQQSRSTRTISAKSANRDSRLTEKDQ